MSTDARIANCELRIAITGKRSAVAFLHLAQLPSLPLVGGAGALRPHERPREAVDAALFDFFRGRWGSHVLVKTSCVFPRKVLVGDRIDNQLLRAAKRPADFNLIPGLDLSMWLGRLSMHEHLAGLARLLRF